jgi:hypothetical protein
MKSDSVFEDNYVGKYSIDRDLKEAEAMAEALASCPQ